MWMLIETFQPIYCWSLSGDGVDRLCINISGTVVGGDWCILILAYNGRLLSLWQSALVLISCCVV